jgi:hypothetical protein
MNDLELEEAYYKTRYIVADIILCVDKTNAQLDDLLIKNNCTTYAFITAQNPLSKLLSENENKILHEQLIAFIKKSEFNYLEGYGEGTGGWPNETSLLILGMRKEEAIACGVKFNQKAIIFGQLRGAASLIMIQ